MTWIVEWVDGQPQEFLDLRDIGRQYYELKQGFFEKLHALVKQAPNYHLRIGALRSVKGSKGVAALYFVLLLVTSTGLAVTLLGETTNKGVRRIVGVWPAQFRAVLEADQDAIANLLYIVAERPEAVQNLEVVF